jgi:hypothetical protein
MSTKSRVYQCDGVELDGREYYYDSKRREWSEWPDKIVMDPATIKLLEARRAAESET